MKNPGPGASTDVNGGVETPNDSSAEPAGQRKADWLEDLFDSTSDLIQIFAVDGTLQLVNKAWCERMGYSEVEAIGRNVFDLIAPDCQEHCQQVFQALLSGEEAPPIVCAFIDRHGRRLSLEGLVTVRFENGLPVAVRGIFRDVSERMRIQEELQQLNATLEARVNQRTRELERTKARLEEAQRLAAVGHWEMDLVSGDLHWSDEICRICGLDPQTVTPSYATFIAMVHPEDRGKLEAGYQQLLATGQPCELQYRLQRADGSVRHILARWSTDCDADGQPVRSIGTSQDVTDVEKSQRQQRDSEARLRSLFESSSLGLVLIEDGERISLANAAFAGISELTPEAIKAGSLPESQYTTHQDLLALSQEALKTNTAATAIKTWPSRDGGSVIVELQASPIPALHDGLRAPLVWIQVEDISERLAAEENLRLAARVFHSAAEGIFLTDRDGVIVDVNEALSRISGYARHEMLGQTPRLFKSGLHSPDFYQMIWTELDEKGTWSGEIVNRARDGSMQDLLETISVVRNHQGEITHYVAMLSDIRQLKAQQHELERLALYDPLTGLANRVQLAQRLHRSMATVKQQGGSITICYVDLDGFKEINDLHGHSAGDSLLQTVAQRMQSLLGAGDCVARLGGDEFVVLLHGIEPGRQEIPWVQNLLDAVVAPVPWNGMALAITASVGVTFYHPGSVAVAGDQLLRIADQAMYAAKRQGKNRYWVAPDEPVA